MKREEGKQVVECQFFNLLVKDNGVKNKNGKERKKGQKEKKERKKENKKDRKQEIKKQNTVNQFSS